MRPASGKIKAWYMRILRGRRQQDEDSNMQLPVWNPTSAVRPTSPNLTIQSMSDGDKEMTVSESSPTKMSAVMHSFELDIEREYRKM